MVHYKAGCRSNPSFHNFSGCSKTFQILNSICNSEQAVALHTLRPQRWWSSIHHVINSAPKQRITEIIQQSARKSHCAVKLCPTLFHFSGWRSRIQSFHCSVERVRSKELKLLFRISLGDNWRNVFLSSFAESRHSSFVLFFWAKKTWRGQTLVKHIPVRPCQRGTS